MSAVAGIDFSSFQADVVLLSEDDDTAIHHVLEFGKTGDAFERARRVREAFPSRGWWLEHCVAVGIEDPRGAARNVDSVLYRIQGAILACLPQMLMVQPWKPGEWRKQLGISNVGKEAPAQFARDRWAWNPTWVGVPEPLDRSQDAADAFCVAWATRDRLVKTQMKGAAA